MPLVAANQLTLDFAPGLTERYTSALDVVRQGAYTHRNPMKTLAADMDMSASELSRKLSQNPDDPRKFTLDDFERFIVASGDLSPIYYLIEKYLQDEEAKDLRLKQQIAAVLPMLMDFAASSAKKKARA